MGIFSCIGKVQFASFEDAQRAAKRRKGRGSPQARGREAYHCRYCNKHHIGSTAPERQKRLARARLLERETFA